MSVSGPLLDMAAELGIATLGATLAMRAGEIDFSIGPVCALAPIVGATLMERGVPFAPAALAGIAVALLVGACNAAGALLGAGSAATLLMAVAARALDWRLATPFPPLLPADVPAWLFTGALGGVGGPARASLLWFAGAALAAALLVALRRWRRAGRRGPAAALLLSAVFAGLAGTVRMLRIGSPLPGLGDALGWQALAAALIGGAFPRGGLGTVPGAVAGAVVVAAIVAWLPDLQADLAVLALAGLAAGASLLRLRRRSR